MNPFFSVLISIWRLLIGRLHFDPHRNGDIFFDENGQCFHTFRYAVLDPKPEQPEKPGAIFIPHFHVANMSVRANILFSLIPMWFIMGLPGFRSKHWMVDEKTGDFSGYYEWDTVEDAITYSTSFAVRFMTNRSIPGSVWFRWYAADQAPLPPKKL
jgi:hypothetical protein